MRADINGNICKLYPKCNSCKECIFDEDFGKEFKSKKMEDFCNNCPNLEAIVVKENEFGVVRNCYCKPKTSNSKILIDTNIIGDVPTPSYCPLKRVSAIKDKSTIEIIRTFKTHVKWEDIKINEVYHLPPIKLLKEDRKDVVIVNVSPSCITYKVLDTKTMTVGNKIDYFFQSTIAWRFLVKHELKDFKTVQK